LTCKATVVRNGRQLENGMQMYATIMKKILTVLMA